jgi:hypothetical protein
LVTKKGGFMGVLLFLIMFLVVYFIPTIVANNMEKKNIMAIFVLNLFLGWTFVGWVIALVWACTE